MKKEKFNIKQEIKHLVKIIQKMDRKVLVIFLAIAVLQTFSWYFTSRRFFRINIFPAYQDSPDIFLIEYLYWFIGDFFTYFILSIVVIKFILKEKLTDYGLTFGDYKTGIRFTLIFLVVMLPLVWFASSSSDFVAKYPHLLSARSNWSEFLIYESGMLIYMFSWEFIWRGFMLFGLKEKFGYYAVLMQMVPFVILHNGKPAPETFSAIIGGIAVGILALRTNSFIYGVIIHMGIMLSIDFICTIRFRVEDYGVGFDSLFNILSKIF